MHMHKTILRKIETLPVANKFNFCHFQQAKYCRVKENYSKEEKKIYHDHNTYY